MSDDSASVGRKSFNCTGSKEETMAPNSILGKKPTDPNKNPVSFLHEIANKKGILLNFQLIQDTPPVEGPVHEPVFKYRLTIEYENKLLEEIGSGKSKKDAKHNTALAILMAMNISPKEIFGETYAEVVPVELDELRVGSADGDLGGNPVGQLQELCMKMKLPPPTYSLHSEDGLPHERIFALACRVGEQHVEIGRGKSKKLAKRHAAHLMAERLRNIPSETSNVHAYDDDDDKIIEGLNLLQLSREPTGKRLLTSTSGDVDKIAELYKIYGDLAMDKMAELKDPEFEVEDPIQYLAEIEDGQFKAVFIDFDEISTVNTYQCFVQVTCDPPVVAIGEGLTKDEAKVNAAKDAIKTFRDLIVGTE